MPFARDVQADFEKRVVSYLERRGYRIFDDRAILKDIFGRSFKAKLVIDSNGAKYILVIKNWKRPVGVNVLARYDIILQRLLHSSHLKPNIRGIIIAAPSFSYSAIAYSERVKNYGIIMMLIDSRQIG
ncbi:hypothetical protein DRO21_02395 [archaeon]|nr:MAG: hypothetical protein DRO21_02395 [archaeon]